MTVLDVALAVLAVAFLLGLIRVVLGPTLADRAVAADICYLTVIAFIAIAAFETGSAEFVDVALVTTLLGFLATVSLAWLIDERRG